MHIDAAFGFAFLDIELAFEIVVFCLFCDFSKSAQANRDFAVPRKFAPRNKTDVSAGEIDPGGIGHSIEIRRAGKPRIGKIGRPLKEAVGENSVVFEARARKENSLKAIRRGATAYGLSFEGNGAFENG
jgi:hypothetical protein